MTAPGGFRLGLVALVALAALGSASWPASTAAVDLDTTPASEIRSAAADVLAQPAYADTGTGLRDWLLDNPVVRFLTDLWERFVDWLATLFPDPGPASPRDADEGAGFGRPSFGVLLLVGIGLVAAVVAARLARGRTAAELQHFHADPEAGLSTTELEAAADAAAGAGDHEGSVRMRFKAGLLTLDRRGIIEHNETTPLGSIRRAVAAGEFDQVADNFEKVTYSDHVAGAEDTEISRSGWRRLLDRLGRGG